MLISFSVENWQSFREKATLSMVASREKQHKDRISRIDKYKMGLLPVAVIYGGNASGKSKFFNALKFVQTFVIKIIQPDSAIPREYFKLDKNCSTRPSKFEIQLLIDNTCYEFSFSVTEQKVVEEKLIKILANSEKILYHRKLGKEISFPDDSELRNDKRLRFVAEGTRDNQLFLTNSVDQRINYFQSIYDWFKLKLILVAPEARFFGNLDYLSMNNIISKVDIGISRLGEKDIPFGDLQWPKEMENKLIDELPEGGQVQIMALNKRIYLINKDRKLHAKKLIPYHRSLEGKEVPFEFDDESAGTIRILDLFPIFLQLMNHKQSRVYFIDELDRCMHTLMTRNFLETYLQSCSTKNRSQLVFTTHDVLLMDQDLLRRDEIWITERDKKGCTSLISFAEYKDVRADKNILKSYLEGRLGGIPKILLWGSEVNKSDG